MKSKTSRRDFLSAGLILPVMGASSAMGLTTSSLGLLQSSEKPIAKPSGSPAKLDYKVLGRTGLKVTTVGMGCMITSDPV